jgi:hypothetical protein
MKLFSHAKYLITRIPLNIYKILNINVRGDKERKRDEIKEEGNKRAGRESVVMKNTSFK